MYFLKWLALSEDFLSENIKDKPLEIKKKWFLDKLDNIEKELNHDFSDNNDENIGWYLFKEKIPDLVDCEREEEWIKIFTYYEEIEAMSQILGHITNDLSEISNWAAFTAIANTNPSTCFNSIERAGKTDLGIKLEYSLFPHGTIVFEDDSLHKLREKLEFIYHTQPQDKTYIESANYLQNISNEGYINLTEEKIDTFWNREF